MAKSRARFLAELLGTDGLVKKAKSALAGADEVIDLSTLPSIPNSKLTNSSITINSSATSLGGSVTLTTANVAENTNLYYTDARADARIAAADTGDLSEGSNLYYTDARADARVNLQTGSNLNLSSKDTGDLSEGSNLYYTNARADARVNLQTGSNLNLSSKNTGDLSEGSNLYYTNARADARIAAASTSDLSEGSNLYYTNARADARIAAASTSDLSEGTNLYYTDARADARVALIVDSAPGTLNTLNELAAALGDDANFSTTVTNSIAAKLPLAGGTLTGSLVTPSLVSGDIDIGDGTAREELKIKSNSYAEVQYFIKHSQNSNVLTEYIRAGAALTESSYGQTIGDYFLYSPQNSKMLLTVPQNGTPLKRNNGAITIIDSTNYGTYALPLSGGTLTGAVSWPSGSSANANTAYTYSQVGHLPLAGGTLSGNVTLSNSDWYQFSPGAMGASSGSYGMGNRADSAYRQLTFHVPNQAAYSSAGTVPSFGWYSNGAVQLMNLQSGTGNLTVTGTISSGAITSSGIVTATGGSSTNWNAAYAYSGIKHVPTNGSTVTTATPVWGIVQNTNTGVNGYSEMHIRNDSGLDLVIGSIGSGYSDASFSDSRYIYSTAGKLHLKATTNLVLSSGGTGTTHVALTADTNQEITIHKDMNLVGEFNGSLFMRDGRITVKQGTGLTTTILPANTSSDRAQLLLDSSYSDMIIASRNVNPNKHGSTLTFATQSTSTADYKKIVIGQGQYQTGAGQLAFTYGLNDSNPHNALGTANADAGVVMDLENKRIGIGGGASINPLATIHASGGRVVIASTDSGYGQMRVANTVSGEVSIGFLNQVTESTLVNANPTATKKWAVGLNVYGIGTDTFGIGNAVDAWGAFRVKEGAKVEIGPQTTSGHGPLLLGSGTASGWGTSIAYPYIGSAVNGSGSIVMIHNPHIPYRTDNLVSGITAKAALRLAIDSAGSNFWDAGLINGDQYGIWRAGVERFTLGDDGGLTLRSSDHNYLYLISTGSYEQMTRYRNGLASDWYTGLRTSTGINDTASYHIYSAAYSGDVFGVNTAGETQMRTAKISAAGGDGTPLLTIEGSAAASFNWISKSLYGNMTAGQHAVHIFGKETNTRNSGYIGYKWAASGSLDNRITFGHYAADDQMYLDANGRLQLNTTTNAARMNVHQTDNAPTAVFTSSNPSTWGASVLIGTTGATQTLVDSNDRPMVIMDGKYPVLNLNHTVTSNSNHGPTIQFTHAAYNSNRQVVIGTDGQGQRLDFGFSGGTAGTNSDKNPHNGIAGYNGLTPMRLFQNGLLLGATGAYPNEISSTDSALDVRGQAKVSGSIWKTSYNQAYLLTSSGTGSSGSSIGFQQTTAEGWTGIFVDYTPNEGWGLYHDNPSNYFYITAEGTTGNLGTSFTVPNRNAGSSVAYAKIRFDQNNGNINSGGAITANGNITAYASDQRLKTNFRTIESAVDKVKQLTGMIFDWNDIADERGFVPDRKYDDVGLIAQHVQSVVPAAVDLAPFDTEVISTQKIKGDKNAGNIEQKKSISGENYLTVNYSKLVPLLVNAIKEQADELKELKQLIKEIKNGNN
jgi:hypothetical protein